MGKGLPGSGVVRDIEAKGPASSHGLVEELGLAPLRQRALHEFDSLADDLRLCLVLTEGQPCCRGEYDRERRGCGSDDLDVLVGCGLHACLGNSECLI
eukprot:scaffold292529_cov31-Tisochrysis_lutea.AAC.3